jgi:putative oxidoreductase
VKGKAGRFAIGVDPGWGITAVRLAAGFVLTLYGYQKFEGGLGAVSSYFARVGIPLPGLAAPLVAVLELVGGILLCLGFATRWLGLLFAVEFAVVTFWVAVPRAGWRGSSLELMLLAAAILFSLAGPGKAALHPE